MSLKTDRQTWAHSAYRPVEIEAGLAERGYRSRIHRRAARNRPLSAREQQGNATRSRMRALIEHMFGHQATARGGALVRTIGIARAVAIPIVETAKMNGIDPQAYLADILGRIADHPINKITTLLPLALETVAHLVSARLAKDRGRQRTLIPRLCD